MTREKSEEEDVDYDAVALKLRIRQDSYQGGTRILPSGLG